MDATTELSRITVLCPFCSTPSSIIAPTIGLDDYFKKGQLIQNALPTLSPEERETIKTGMCLQCQSQIFNSQDI